MTAQTLILAYQRASLVHMPRRDLVLSSADSLALRVTIVETDDPSARLLDTRLGDPSCRLAVWGGRGEQWDYGRLFWSSILFSAIGVASETDGGTFDFQIPTGAMASWPRRCGWAIQLYFGNDPGQSQTLAHGQLHVAPAPAGQTVGAEFDTDFDHGDFK